jgi:hypothetical protein
VSRRLIRLVALMVGAGAVALPARPVRALAPGIHGFAVTATVENYPCVIPYCSGTLAGTGAAVVTGLSTTSQPFAATWPNPKQPLATSNTTGSLFDLVDSCPVGSLAPSPGGSGSGSFTLSGGLLVYQGQALSGATLSGSFSWQRVADDLVITVSGATVTAPNGTVVAFQETLADGAGDGAWAVTSGVGACGAPLTNPTVRISANYLAPE